MTGLDICLWYSSISLKWLSLSPISSKASGFRKTLNSAHFLFVILNVILFFVQMSIYVVQNSTGSLFITGHINIQIAILQSISKLTIYRFNQTKYFKLIKNLNNMLKNGTPDLKRHLKYYESICHLIYLSYTFIVLFLAIDTCVSPVFKSGKELPLEAWYPFDYETSTLLYLIAYFYQIFVTILVCLSITVDIIFGVMVFSCCARLKVVQEVLEGSGNQNGDLLRRGKNLAGFDQKIAQLVELHREIFDSIKDINDLHTYIVFILFLTSVVMICCAGFQLTMVSEQSINSKLVFCGMIGYALLSLLFYFLPGELLINEAYAVGSAAYHSNWESMSPKVRKCLLLIMIRSAKPPKLDVARVKPLTLNNYGSFLATTASYFTSLRAIVKTE